MFKSSDFIKEEVARVENNEPLTTDIGTFEQEINDFLKKISHDQTQNAKTTPTAPANEAPAAPISAATPAVTQVAVAPAEYDQGFPYSVRVFLKKRRKWKTFAL